MAWEVDRASSDAGAGTPEGLVLALAPQGLASGPDPKPREEKLNLTPEPAELESGKAIPPAARPPVTREATQRLLESTSHCIRFSLFPASDLRHKNRKKRTVMETTHLN